MKRLMLAATELGPVAWPPAPIRTERLVLRAPEARDRAPYIELLASPEVGTDTAARAFVADLDGAMIGQVILRRATGHGAGEAELGYLFLPEACRPAPR